MQAKLGEMAARILAAESVVYRVAGLLDTHSDTLAAGEEFAIECAIAKVYCTEALGRVVDTAIQLVGGLSANPAVPGVPVQHAS